MEELLEWLEFMEDSRQTKKVKHELKDIIVIVLFASLAKADDFTDMEYFAVQNEEFLKKYIEIYTPIFISYFCLIFSSDCGILKLTIILRSDFMKEARNLVDLEPVSCRSTELTGGLTQEQEDEIAEALFMTTEEILESLERSEEDFKAGRVYDAFDCIKELRAKHGI